MKSDNGALQVLGILPPDDQLPFTELVDDLRSICVENQVGQKQYRRITWLKHFNLLADEVGALKMVIVFDWYLMNFPANGKNLYVPRAYSSITFRQKFSRIEAAIDRSMLKMKLEDVTISDDARDLAKSLIPANWPMDSGKQLPLAVELGIQYLLAILKKVEDLCQNYVIYLREHNLYHTADRLRKTLNHNSYITFLEVYFYNALEHADHWEDWSGDMKTYIPSDTCKFFNRYMREEIEGWNNLKEALNEDH